jgi:histidinol phosphatase-like enzyme (inositol monophosphatase family)
VIFSLALTPVSYARLQSSRKDSSLPATPSLKELLAVATDAAYLAGRRTLAYFNTGVEVETKSDDTPVTRADREAEQLIRDLIVKRYPDHTIIGEEGGETAGDPGHKWIIDPIDGTKSFIHGVPMYGVLIGVEVRGEPVVGAVYLPATDELLCAARGLGATHNGRAARVSPVNQLSKACLLTSSFQGSLERSDAYEILMNRCRISRGWGDCYGHVLVATGRAEVMLDPRMNPWDCAPLLPIYREAGGHYTTWTGDPTIWGPDGVGTNAGLHREVLDLLRAENVKPGWKAKP